MSNEQIFLIFPNFLICSSKGYTGFLDFKVEIFSQIVRQLISFICFTEVPFYLQQIKSVTRRLRIPKYYELLVVICEKKLVPVKMFKAPSHSCSIEQLFREISQNFQRTINAVAFFLITFQPQPYASNFTKKQTILQMFFSEFY